MENGKEFLKPAEVGPLLGLSTGRIYQLIADGVLPSVRIGGAIRIPRAAWEAWLEEQKARALEAVRPGCGG